MSTKDIASLPFGSVIHIDRGFRKGLWFVCEGMESTILMPATGRGSWLWLNRPGFHSFTDIRLRAKITLVFKPSHA